MQNKQTSSSFKELFCFYMSNHVRLGSIMWNCALIILVLTISRNLGVEAIKENGSKFNTDTYLQEKTTTTLLPKNTTNTTNRTTNSIGKVHDIQIQAVYNPERNKIILNVTWDKPTDWDQIHSYDFKITPNSSDCTYESFETIKKDKTLTNILLPPPFHKYEILPGCTYKVNVIINRSDLHQSISQIIYTIPECVDKKCSCINLTPQLTNFHAVETAPAKLNISWKVDHTGGNGKMHNITNFIFEYRPNLSGQFHNNPFSKLELPLDFNQRSSYFILENTDLFVINKEYELQAIFSNSYNCKAFSNTTFTVTATKPHGDIKQATKFDTTKTESDLNESTFSTNAYENVEGTSFLDSKLQVPNLTTLKNINTVDDATAGKVCNVTVQAVYERHKIVLNVTWNKPLDWKHIRSYDFKLSPDSSQAYCMHQSSFETINKDKNLINILIPPPHNIYEIIAGCTYKISILSNRSYLGKGVTEITYRVPECVGKKCSCSKLTPQFNNFEVLETTPGKLNISWEINQTKENDKVYNITNRTFGYRPSMLEFHNNPFRKLVLPSDLNPGRNYFILDDTHIFATDEQYELQAIFDNTYGCKAYGYTNFTVTAAKLHKESKQDTSWVQLLIFFIFSSFLILAVIYILRRNRLVIKEILLNPLSLRFSRRRSRRAEARTSYIMVPTITKRQQQTNLLYIDKEIIDGDADRYEFPRSRISLIREIGEGAFGQVFLAKAFGIEQQPGYTFVAVKTLRERAPPEEMDDFLSEIDILKRVGEHPNIVRIFGCCILKEPYLMVMEFVPCGDLKHYLLELREKWRKKRTRNDSTPVFSDTSDGAYVLPDSPMSRTGRIPSEGRPSVTETEYTTFDSDGFPTPTEPFNNKVGHSLDHTELQNFALQIAKGMEHLERIPIAHRDLAARNILINEYKTLKISDFGLSRIGPYVNSRTKKMPLRWVSLEAIEDHFYDSKGDVWSFAVVLWEIGTLGAFPYENILDGMVPHYLASGKRLPRPEICTDDLYSLMLRCWSRDPQLRPSFQELVELLDVKQRRIYVDFNQLNPLYVFPPCKVQEFDRNSNFKQNDSTA